MYLLHKDSDFIKIAKEFKLKILTGVDMKDKGE
jgi:hypothetical protein